MTHYSTVRLSVALRSRAVHKRVPAAFMMHLTKCFEGFTLASNKQRANDSIACVAAQGLQPYVSVLSKASVRDEDTQLFKSPQWIALADS